MITLDPRQIPQHKFHGYMLGAVTPRPIAFASTVDHEGNVNLSPFSFFNCFGSNPPLLIFSPARRGRDNTVKHTYENVLEVPEVVINVVTYNIVQQTSLASVEFPKGVNEFAKAGFTQETSTFVKPPRVKESPISMECKVLQVIPTGDQGGAGNLVLCEILLMHIDESVLDSDGRIDPFKLDAVGRLGGDYYCRVHADAIFKVPKPSDKLSIGIDGLPADIRNSKVLTGNHLGLLANVQHLPDFKGLAQAGTDIEQTHRQAAALIDKGDVEQAWQLLLAASNQINIKR